MVMKGRPSNLTIHLERIVFRRVDNVPWINTKLIEEQFAILHDDVVPVPYP